MSDNSATRPPFQIRLIDAIAIMAVVALVSSVAAPLIRALTADQLKLAGWMMLIGLLFGAIGFFNSLYLRHLVLRKGGRRLGYGFRSSQRSRLAPEWSSLVTMLIVAAAQILLSLLMVWKKDDEVLILYTWLSFATGYCTANFLAKTYPFAVGVFENGVNWAPGKLVPWNQVSVRRSSLRDNCLVFVGRMGGRKGDVKSTMVVCLDPQMCDEVIARSGAPRDGDDPSVSGLAPEIE